MSVDKVRMLVLAGGFGERLRPAVSIVPKALAPVGTIPFLQIQLENWIAQGIRSFVFLLHYRAELIIEFLESQKGRLLKNCEVVWIVEQTPMDTGGAVANAVRSLDISGEFLLTNADTWLGNGISDVLRVRAPAIAVIESTNVSRYGQLILGEEGRVTSFSEKGASQDAGWINAGMGLFSSVDFMSWNGQPFSLERVYFRDLVENGRLIAVKLRTEFIDIGVPEDYFRFCRWIEEDRKGKL